MSPKTRVLKRGGAKKVRDKNFVASTEKIFAVLEAFSQHPHSAMSLEEITQSARLAKTTLHRLLYSMQKIGYVDQHRENGKYMLSQKFFELGRDALPYQRLTSLAKPFINALMLRFGESIHIGVLENGLVTNIAVCESQHPYRIAGVVGDSSYATAPPWENVSWRSSLTPSLTTSSVFMDCRNGLRQPLRTARS